MANAVPAISVTDPQSRDARPISPLPAQSPVKKGLDRVAAAVSNGVGPGKTASAAGSFEDNTIKSNSSSQGAQPTSPSPSPILPRPATLPTDSLSQHVIKRSTAPAALGKEGTQQSTGGPGLNILTGPDSTSRKITTGESAADGTMLPPPLPKDKKKGGVKFFSRFIGNKRVSTSDSPQDKNETETLNERPDGADAELFYEPVDNIEFSPRHPLPPRYVRVNATGKKTKEFDRLFLAQELHDAEKRSGNLARSATSGSTSSRMGKVKSSENKSAIWALEFSKDGKYVASGGQEKVVRVWATLTSVDDRKKSKTAENADDKAPSSGPHLRAPVFTEKPIRLFEGHTSPVLDISWSKNNFLLSSSMDKTVRLWHVSRPECLCAFKHNDFVTSIQFHPKDDRFFLAGSLDSKLRLWSIPDKSVAFWNSVPEMITAVSFTPDGKTAIAGCATGQCFFYETEGLKYSTQMHVKSAHGKNAKGSKITGIQTTNMPPSDPNGDVKLLITSNDSRIRLYNLRDKSLEMKLKGNENVSSQIHARFSDDCRYIICGSEDKRVFIWSLTGPVSDDFDRKGRRPVEVFEAHNAATTVCAIAPTRTRQLLGGSEDPLFDLCNPPPVKLVSKSEAASTRSGRIFDDNSSIQQTPPALEGPAFFNKPDVAPAVTPAYISRSTHDDGGIIVTADASGFIKVFRQDCAYDKRLRSEFTDVSSMSRAFSSSNMRRQGSRTSSRRSVTRKDSDSTQPPRDRILSWRQSIGSLNSVDAVAGRRGSPVITGARRASTRSTSPRKTAQRSDSYRSNLVQASQNGSSPALGSSNAPSSPDDEGPQRPSLDLKRANSNSSQSAGQMHQMIEGKDNGSGISQTDPRKRNDSRNTNVHYTDDKTYFQRDAWHDQIQEQIQCGEQLKAVRADAARSGGGGSGLAVPPGLLERQNSYGSAISSVSMLTDDEPSLGAPTPAERTKGLF